jgi:hypothetical protein
MTSVGAENNCSNTQSGGGVAGIRIGLLESFGPELTNLLLVVHSGISAWKEGETLE